MLDQVTCVGYIRVSTERQADEVHTSLEDQTQAIEGLAEKLGVTAGCWFRDAGASGATAEGRPAFMEMLGWCEQNSRPMDSPGHVLVLNDSRFGRFVEPEEATFWRHHLYRLGWIVRFCEGDEVEGDFRSIVRAIGSVQATEYRRNLVANTRRGMKGAAEQGFWTREAPYGYRRQVVYPPGAGRVLEIGQLKAPNEKVKLAPHTEEARMVRWAFEVYAAGGASLGSLSGDLQKRVPRRRWSRQVVGAMLKNHAYRGAVVGGRRREGGSERYGCEGAHQAIVTDALWNAVQARLEANRHRGRGVRSHYLVSGILRCSHCGESYTGGGGGRSRSKNPQRSHRRFYRDNGGTSGVCPGRIGTVMRHLVDAALVDVIGSTITRPAVRRRIERAIGDAMSGTSGSVGDSEVAARVERARWEKKRDRLIDAVADGTLLPEETSAQLEEIRAALAQIEGQMQALRFSRSRTQSVRSERGRLLEIAMDFPEVAARLSGPALRELVAPWVGALTFDKVGRVLSVGIRPIPAVPSLVPYPLPARVDGDSPMRDRMVHVAQGGDNAFATLSDGGMWKADNHERGESHRNVDLHRHRMALDSGERSGTDLRQHGFLPYGPTSPERARRPYADGGCGAGPYPNGTRQAAGKDVLWPKRRLPPRREAMGSEPSSPQPNSGGVRVWKSVASCQAFATLSVSASAQS